MRPSRKKEAVPGKYPPVRIATAVAVLFHCIGLTGLLFFDKNTFLAATPINLLLMGILLTWTQQGKNRSFYLFLFCCLIVGVIVEIIGVRSALLFGHYSYGAMMGMQFMNTPLITGINWFIVIYGSATCHLLLKDRRYPALVVIGAGALLATGSDWLMEPVASKLGYWTWDGDGTVPFYNYVCWFLISALLLAVFHFSQFKKPNRFAAYLMLIQVLFFLILRIALDDFQKSGTGFFLYILVALGTFVFMEGVSWFLHRYVMHGFLWVLHKDHHQKEPGFFEKNDYFFLIFAIPSWLFIMLGVIYQNYWSVSIGAGLSLYGMAYFLVHEVIIHQRIRWFSRSNNLYVRSLRWSHKMHHKHLDRFNGESFGMLWVGKKYWEKVRNDRKRNGI